MRPFTRDDLPAFVAYRSAPGVAAYQSWDAGYAMADAEAFLADQHDLAFGQRGVWFQLAVVDRTTSGLLGDCAVRVAEDQPRTAELGVTVAPEHQGRGIATEALSAMADHLFGELRFHRLFAETDDRNLAAHRVFERLRFRCEARLIDADWFKGEWTTLRVYAVLRDEWRRRSR